MTVVEAVSVAEADFDREALRHLDALYAFALRLTRQRDDAEDLVSDTVLRAFERWHQYQPGTNSRAWLFTILYRGFVSRRRRMRARETSFADRDGASTLDDVIGEADPEGNGEVTALPCSPAAPAMPCGVCG